MGGGGKGGSTTVNKTEIPPEVLARYNAVNARAEAVAKQPYQRYSNDPNAFVAGLTPTQQAGIQNTNIMAGAAQPFYQAGAAATLGGMQNVGPLTQQQIGYYQNPYTQAVVNPTLQALQQQQGQQLAQQQSEAIKGGAFGGDRAGLARAQLMGQQNLAQAQAIAPLYQRGFDTAAQIAAGQQGVVAGDLARMLTGGQQLANLGAGAQQAGLAGAQAQMQAGQVQQQTEQAGKQAMYNQFMQEQGYPFQVAQFLANIATGTGALSGNQSTSTTTGGGGFFSDKRLKENVEKVGETNDGQPIYRYNYKGDPRTQIGLMAQDVEKDHPEAVGLAGGYKTVDYKKATQDAVRKQGGGAMSDDAYSMNAPSQMLDRPAGLGALALPQMMTGAGIPVRSMTPASEIEALRAPKATGFSPGTMEGARAEAASLRSALSSGRGADIGSGPEYMQSRLSELDKFLAQNSSQGGLVGPEGGAFSRGGYAFGGGPYGVQLEPMQQRQMLQAAPVQRPAERNALAEAKNIAELASLGYAGYKNRPNFLRSAEDVAAREQTEQALKARELLDIERASKLERAHGGLIGDREAYRGQGYVNTSSNPYSGVAGGYLDDTLQLQQETPRPSLDVKGAPKPQPAKSGLGELVQTANAGNSLYKGGKWAADKLGLGASPTAMSATSTGVIPEAIDLTSAAPGLAGAAEGAGAAAGAGEALAGGAAAAEGLAGATGLAELGTGLAAAGTTALEALPFLAFLSDERAKHDIKKVGTLFDGQPVYRYAYNGDDKTQMGLIAQKVEKTHPEAVGLAGGMKTVDYEKATDKAAKRGHYQTRGLVEGEDVAEGGGDTTTTGGDGTTIVGRSARLPVTAKPVPTPADAVAAVPAPAPRAPGVASGSRPSIPDIGGLVPEGMKDTLSSENFWVPALAGIGAMLASPNKTLAGAIGSGLVGGTTAYTDLQKQQADQLMKRLQINKDRFTGPVLINGEERYKDTVHGDWVNEATMQSRLATFFGQPKLGPTPGAVPSTPATTAVTTAREEVEAPKPKLETAGKPPASAPPTGAPEAQAPAATTEAPKPPATAAQTAATPAQATGEKVSNDPMAPPPSKLDLMNQARKNPALFADVPENRRPDYLEKEAQRLQAEAAEYQRQADKFASDAAKLAKNPAVQAQYTSEATRLTSLATARRTEADQKNQAANKALEEAIGPALRTSEKLADAQAELKMAGPKASEALKAKVAELHETLKHENAKYSFTENYKRQQELKKEAATEAKEGQQILNQTKTVMDTVFDKDGKPKISGGPLGPQIAKYASLFAQAGLDPKRVMDIFGTDPTAAEALNKINASMTAEISRLEMAGSPVRVTEWNAFLKANPGLDILPASLKFIVEKIIDPKAKSMVGSYDAVRKLDPGKDDIENTLFDYRQNNPWAGLGKAPEEGAAQPSAAAAPAGAIPPGKEDLVRQELERRRAAQGAR